MGLGQITRGSLKHLREETASEYHRILNIDKSSKLEKRVAKTLESRGKTHTAFDGDNHFHGQITKEMKIKNQNWRKARNGSVLTKCFKENCSLLSQEPTVNSVGYYPRVSQVQTGDVDPILKFKGTQSRMTDYVPGGGSTTATRFSNAKNSNIKSSDIASLDFQNDSITLADLKKVTSTTDDKRLALHKQITQESMNNAI